MGFPEKPDADAACPKCGDGVLFVTRYWGEGYQATCFAPHCGFSESRLHAPPADAEPGYSAPQHDGEPTAAQGETV